MMDFEKIRVVATFNRDFEREDALRMAERYMATGDETFKKRFEEHLELSKRWEWARAVAARRPLVTDDGFKECREGYPKIYRVRPQ